MEILVPKNTFLRVGEKFSARFAKKDKTLPRDPQDVYLHIFDLAADTGVLRGVPQQHIADECKMCVRAVQYALRELERLGYLHVESTPGQPSTYVLLLSAHVRKQIRNCDTALVHDPDWYPRDTRREGSVNRPAVAASTAVSSPAPSAPGRVTPGARGGYAPHAYPSYKDKKKEEISPLTPLRTQGAAGPVPPRICGGDSFPAEVKRLPAPGDGDVRSAFERLWRLWPIRQDRTRALRVFASLARAGKLPPLEALLRAVETFRERDARWKRGYAPHLGNWLRGRRWEDEPVERGAGSSSGARFEPVSAARTDAKGKVAAAYVPPELTLPELPQHLVDTVENLCRFWPQETPRRPVQAFFRSLLASGTAPDPDGVVATAKAYLQETFSPGSLVGWLRNVVGASSEKSKILPCPYRIPCLSA